MERQAYIIKSQSAFMVWRTYNHKFISDRERWKDSKSNYPMQIPRPSKNQIRIDGISNTGYYYGLLADPLTPIKDNLIALIKIGHEGIIEIINLTEGIIKGTR